jgi:tetraacyldisaccharide 4'-kinase
MLHRNLYERRWLRSRRLDCRVVSVGNLVVGGTGKTPIAAWIAARLRERGHRVVLASRGYGRARQEPVTVVSDGRSLCVDPARAGDEPLLMAARAPGVPVLVGPDRGMVGLRAVSLFGAEVLVLDDGFQHHRLARDVEIVSFDGAFGLGNRHLLPRGPLREHPAALSRSHALWVVDPPLSDADAALVALRAPGARRFRARRRPASLRPLGGPAVAGLDCLGTLRGMKVGLLASIAHPESFQRTLDSLGAEVVARRSFRDHHRYRAADLRGLTRRAAVWITTEKDAVKIAPSWLGALDLRVLRIELEVEEPEAFLDWLEAQLALLPQ